jgi:hypothetical protein
MPCELPPGCVDLGNGEVLVFGTAADHRAAAAWLRERYPDGATGPRADPMHGPVLNMTWLKLSDDFADDCARASLSDAAMRTHVEGLIWTMRRETGGQLNRLDVRRAIETLDPDSAVAELVKAGFWAEQDGGWLILHAMDDQPEPDLIAARRAKTSERVRKHRRSKAGLDKEPGTGNGVTGAVTEALPGTGRDGTGRDGVALRPKVKSYWLIARICKWRVAPATKSTVKESHRKLGKPPSSRWLGTPKYMTFSRSLRRHRHRAQPQTVTRVRAREPNGSTAAIRPPARRCQASGEPVRSAGTRPRSC